MNKNMNQSIYLPTEVALLTAPGNLLAPQGVMHFLVTDPEMREAVEESFAHHRMIGIMQAAPETMKKPRRGGLFEVGCLGRITGFTELEEGGMLLIILGVCRFDLVRSRKSKEGFRRAEVSYDYFLDDILYKNRRLKNRDSLLRLLEESFRGPTHSINWKDLQGISDQKILSTITMLGPFSAPEKQALLECRHVDDQAELLEAMIEFALMKKEGNPHITH